MSEAGTRSNRTVDYLMPDRKHSSKQLERRGMKNSSACDYERQDVIFGMNAISHVPEPYLDPVLLIGGRRIVSTTFKWSYKIVADERKLNNSLRNLEPCGDPETADEYMEESDSSGNGSRPVPKPRVRKVISLDPSDAHPPAAATLPPGGAGSLSTQNHHVNSHSSSTYTSPVPRPSTAPPPVQRRNRSASAIGVGPTSSANTTTTQATQGSAAYEAPASECKSRPKPPRPPPPKAALIQKYTKKPDKAAAAASDKRNVAPSPTAAQSKKETRKPNHDSLHGSMNQRTKQPSPVTRTQSTATSTSSSDNRESAHDYEDADKFLLSPQPQPESPKVTGRESPTPNSGGGETTAAPVLPPRSTPAKKKSKLSMLVKGGQSGKPTPYRQQGNEDSGLQQQDCGEYSEIKDDDYTDMHPANHEPSPKPNDVYMDMHPKSAVDDYQLMDDDQPGSLYASSDLLANRPDLKL